MTTTTISNTATTHKLFSPARVWALANNSLLELVRLKVFYFLLLFALLIIGSSAFMMDFKIQEQFQVLKDMSLGAMSIFTLLLSILATAMMLPKDIEDRTLYTILAKPVPRFEYLLGKLLGVLLLLLISTLLMSAMFAIALYVREQLVLGETMQQVRGMPSEQAQAMIADVKASAFTSSIIPGIVTIYLKASLFASLTLFISTYASSSIFTIFVAFTIYFIGSVEGVAREYWLSSGNASSLTKIFLAFVSLMFPDLQLFNLIDDIVAGNAIHLAMFWKTAGLGVSYIAVYLLAAYFVFANKEL